MTNGLSAYRPGETSLSPFAGMDAAALLRRRAEERPGHPLLIWSPPDGEERSWTYAAFAEEVARIAGGLQARGIAPGDRVIVHLENCPEALLARFACAWMGAVCVATNAMASETELAAMIETTGARAAITQPRLAPLLMNARSLEWVAVTATDAGTPPGLGDAAAPGERFDRLASAAPLPPRAPDPSCPAQILFTTGTTARAKAVLWSHENLLWAAALGASQQKLRPDDVGHLFLPLFHVVGYSWTFLPLLWAGGTIVLQPRFSASRFWPVALKHKATLSSHVPFTLTALGAQQVPAGHSFRQWITNRQIGEVRSRFGVPKCFSAWGMTEMVAQPIIGDTDLFPLAEGAIGRPSYGYGLHVVDEHGNAVGPGGEGELLVKGVRGRSIFREYFNAPDATRQAFDEQGRFRTGDRVRLCDDGSLLFLDRLKDVIKVGGEGVSSSEIETVIRSVAGVRDVAVVARPDALRSEVPVAFVVLDEAASSDGQNGMAGTIEAHCREQMARFKVPQEIRFLDQLPRVGFGKIAKAKLREIASAGDEAGSA